MFIYSEHGFCGAVYLPTYLPNYTNYIPTQHSATDEDRGAASVMCRDAHMSLHFESTQIVVWSGFSYARKKDDAVQFSAPFVASVGQALGLSLGGIQEVTFSGNARRRA